MAIGLRLKFPGGSQEAYDAVNSRINPEADPPDGLIFHSAGPIDEGWGIIDFWESREHFDRFMHERIQPAMQDASDQAMPGPPDIREFPVYNYMKP